MLKYTSIFFFFLLVCCTRRPELGTTKNPVKFSLVPGQNSLVLEEKGKELQQWLRTKTGYAIDLNVPTSYVAVVEALGSKRADVAIINTFGYLLAHEKYQVEARLIGVNKGRSEYQGQIIVPADGARRLQDLDGKKFAFVDPASTSGYLLAVDFLKKNHIHPKETVFAGKHDSVVSMVYQHRVDAGATYNAPAEDGSPQDARLLVKTQYPDVFQKVRILALTGGIPSEPVVFRRDLPEDMKKKIMAALISFGKTEKGRQTLLEIYHLTGFRECDDKTYDPVRQVLLNLGKQAGDLVH